MVSETVRGAYGQYAVAAADRLVPVPGEVSSRLAAAVLLQGMTAHYLAYATYRLAPGDTCLVHAAAGGLGLLLCQIASRIGARVIGTVSTDEKAALARRAGAHEVILYTRVDFLDEVRRLTGGAGVQVIYDSVGARPFSRASIVWPGAACWCCAASRAGRSSRSIPSCSTPRAHSSDQADAGPLHRHPRRAAGAGGRGAGVGGGRSARGPYRRRLPAGARRRTPIASSRPAEPPARCC